MFQLDRIAWDDPVLTATTIYVWAFKGESKWKRYFRLSFRSLLAFSAAKRSARSCSRWR